MNKQHWFGLPKMMVGGIAFFGLLVAGGPIAQAQNWGEESDLDDTEIIIEKDRRIELPQAVRNYQKIAPPEAQIGLQNMRYDFRNIDFQVSDLQPRMRVLTIKDDPLPKLYGNYVKAGFGNYITPYFEGFFNNKRNDKYAYGIHARHLSSARGPVDGANSAFSENEINLQGKYFTKVVTFDGNVGYERLHNNFYGYAPGTEVDKDTIGQVFHIFRASAGISNANVSRTSYRLGGDFSAMRNAYDARETQAGVVLSSKFNWTDNFGIRLDGDLYNINYADSGSIQRNLFRIKPAFEFELDGLQVTAGFNIAYENDTLSNADRVHFYPRARIDYAFSDNLKVYGGVEGDLEKVALQDLIRQNPFLDQDIPVFHTNKTMEFYAGLRTNIMDRVALNTGISVASYRNLYFFTNSARDSSRFDVQYDEGTTTVFNYFAELSYAKDDVFRTYFRTDLYSYNTGDLEEAWHRPNYKLNWYASYNLYGKIRFAADANLLGGITARNFVTNETFELDPIVDLSFKTEYLFSDRFSVWFSLNNLLGNEYQRYLYYPSRGFLGMLGASYAF